MNRRDFLMLLGKGVAVATVVATVGVPEIVTSAPVKEIELDHSLQHGTYQGTNWDTIYIGGDFANHDAGILCRWDGETFSILDKISR